MPSRYPCISTLEEFCKYFEQESDIGKRRLFEVHQFAQKRLEARRRRDKERYAEKTKGVKSKRTQEFEDLCNSVLKEIEQPPEPVPEPSAPLPTIQEEPAAQPPPPKVKRPSFTIPIPTPQSLVSQPTQMPSFPSIISDTKKKREAKKPV